MTPPALPKITESRQELLRYLAEQQAKTQLAPLPEDALRPLSFVQERIWVSEKLAGGVAGGSYTGTITLEGDLNSGALECALAEIYHRHEILRTTFGGGDEPTQAIHPSVDFRLAIRDLSDLDGTVQQDAVRKLVNEETHRRFDLSRWPLLRFELIRLSATNNVLTFSFHHMVSDGWSTGLLFAELSSLYSSFATGIDSQLPDLPVQYSDYAAWERQSAGSLETQEHLAYWKRRLSGQIPPLELPTDRPRSSIRTFAAGTLGFNIPGPRLEQVKDLARAEGATPFITLLAAFVALLHRCTGQDDLAVGSPVANRRQREVESLIGCFMQPLVLRMDMTGDPTFRELVGRAREVCLGAYAHQDVPFELVMRAIRPKWQALYLPVFQVMFNVQRSGEGRLQLPGLVAKPADLQVPSAALDLSIDLWLGDDGVVGGVEYSSELFDEATVGWLMRCYTSLLGNALDNPDRRISALLVSGREERADLAADSGGSEMARKRRELMRLLAEQSPTSNLSEQVVQTVSAQPQPCSFGQERLWFMDRLAPDSAVYNQIQSLELTGPLDVGALESALAEIVRRHGSLRTAILTDGGRPVQQVMPSVEVKVPLIDLSKLPGAERKAEAQRVLEEQASLPFDLTRPPLCRVCVIRLGFDQHLLYLTAHHLVTDGWSMRVFRSELTHIYGALAEGRQVDIAPPTLQYVDFARRQRSWYREAIIQGQLAYWKRQLGGDLPLLDLPTDRPHPPGMLMGRKQVLPFRLDDATRAGIDELQKATGATPFMVLLAAFYTLLHRYTGQEDLLVDTPISGRSRRELEGVIGFFVNSLVLRANLKGTPTFRDFLGKVRQMCLDAYANQDLPFDRVVAQLAMPPERRGQSMTPVSFMLHETVAKHEELGGGVVVNPGSYLLNDEFDLTMVIWQAPDGLSGGDLQYDATLFDPGSAERLARSYQTLLRSLVADPECRVSDLGIQPAEELHQLLMEFNDTKTLVRSGLTLHGLFEEQAARVPAEVAIIVPPVPGTNQSEQQLTYGELNAAANRLACYLADQGVGPESRVAICMGRSTDLVVAVLGVLKAGATFIPIDPSQGVQRLKFMLEDSRATVALANRTLLVEWALTAQVIELDEIGDQLANYRSENCSFPVHPDQLAYVIYTSGSTGRPKGVMVTHRSLVNAYFGWESAYGLKDLTCHLQMANFSFDVFAGDLTRALCSGARMVLCPRESLLVAPELADLVDRYRVDCAEFVPAAVRPLADHLSASNRRLDSFKLAIVGSDVWYGREYDQLAGLLGKDVRLVNSYGVAEATIDSTRFESTDHHLEGDSLVPIGKPFANCRTYVLDAHLNPVPLGAAGELYIAGDGLARGYSDREQLTAERFIPDPFSTVPGARLYRTGDRARYLPDGNIAFLGRVDSQIKIRGFRIEPGEIECVLEEHERVLQAVVVVYESRPRNRQLAAYVVLDPGFRRTHSSEDNDEDLQKELRIALRTQLPDYMVPSAIVVLDEIPLTPNAKVNTRALPPPVESAEWGGTFTGPATDVQRRVASIWSEILGEEKVGLNENFFDLGGHSLLLFELQGKLREAFGEEIPIVDLFRLTTVEDLARRFTAPTPESPTLDEARDRARKLRASLQQQGKAARARRDRP